MIKLIKSLLSSLFKKDMKFLENQYDKVDTMVWHDCPYGECVPYDRNKGVLIKLYEWLKRK